MTYPHGPVTTRGKKPPAKIEEERDRHTASVNAAARATPPEYVTTITEFVESVYLPWAQANRRAPTLNGYRKIWKKHLRRHF